MTNKEITDKWFDAFNKHDLDALLNLYDENARHYSPKLKLKFPDSNGWVKGKVALQIWWKDAFDNLPTLKYFPEEIISENENVFMRYRRSVENQDDLLVGETLKIVNGLIVESRVFHS